MSLIADSLKKIEKGDNETPDKSKEFVAPPLMQKTFGGGVKGGPGKKTKKNSIFYLALLVGVVIIAGGLGIFLYMNGTLEAIFLPKKSLPVARTEYSANDELTAKEIPINNTAVQTPIEGNQLPADNNTENTGMEITFTDTAQPDNLTKNTPAPVVTEADNAIVAVADNNTITEPDNNTAPINVAEAIAPNTTENGTTITEETAVPLSIIAQSVSAQTQPTETSVEIPKLDNMESAVTPAEPIKPAVIAEKPQTTNNKIEKTASNSAKKSSATASKSTSYAPTVAVTPKPLTTKPKVGLKPTPQPETSIVDNPDPVIPRKPVDNKKLNYTALISQGDAAIDKKDYELALELFTRASEIESSDILQGNMAALQIKLGKAALASELMIVNKIKDPAIISGLIIDMSDNKNFVQALVLLKYAADNIPLNSQIVYAEGYYYEAQRGYIKAAEFYQKAFAMNPREIAYLYAYARCLDFSEQYYKALESYIKVAEMRPDLQLKTVVDQRIISLQSYLKR